MTGESKFRGVIGDYDTGTYRDLTIVNTITRMGDLTLGVVNSKWISVIHSNGMTVSSVASRSYLSDTSTAKPLH